MLGREPKDVDLVTSEDPRGAARAFADSVGGSYFPLSDEFKLCRVLAPGGDTYDFAQCRGADIEADLSQRDFTVNAMAVAIPGGETVIDPYGGRDHLDDRILVAVSSSIFADDPLRLLRAVRLEKQLRLKIPPELAELALNHSHSVNEPAAERTFFELVRIIEAPGTGGAVRRMDELGLLERLLPELKDLQGVTQNDFHHLDVYDHTLAVAEELGRLLEDPDAVFPEAAATIKKRLAQAVAGDLDVRQALSMAAVMHDIAKLECRFEDEEERVRFIDHDRLGEDAAGRILARFKASTKASRAVRLLVRQHMRLVFLVKEPAVSDRARLRFFRATEPFTPESILLSVADRLAVRGPMSTATDIEHHLIFAREMMNRYLVEAAAVPSVPLVSGGELIEELGLEAGPVVGRIVKVIEEEQRLGNVSTREEALELARELAERET